MSEINVTPLVDVMLVLLVIFMITAPLMATGVQVDLPKAETAQMPTPEEPLSITVSKAGKIFLGDREVAMDALIARIKATAANNPEARVFVRGDQAIAYGQMMTVIAIMAGLLPILWFVVRSYRRFARASRLASSSKGYSLRLRRWLSNTPLSSRSSPSLGSISPHSRLTASAPCQQRSPSIRIAPSARLKPCWASCWRLS